MQRTVLAKIILLLAIASPMPVLGDLEVDFFHPKQLSPEGKREIMTRLPPKVDLEAVEIMPADDIVVSDIRQLDKESAGRGGLRWRITFEVSEGATPGERAVVLVTSKGRSQTFTVTIPPHAPQVIEISAIKSTLSPVHVDLYALVKDSEDDLGESPSISSSLRCGGGIIVGIGKARQISKVGDHLYRLEFGVGGDPNTNATGETACTLKVTVTDEAGYEGDLETAILLKEEG